MGSKGPDKKGNKPQAQADPPSLSQQAFDPVIRSDVPFPVPELYFKVFESEVDEPEGKIRRDVGKLYERWEKKHGRRWPENGMNTEDLVWLAEEAYKPNLSLDERGNVPVQKASLGAARARLVPAEEERYPGEFLDEPANDTPAPSTSTGKAPGRRSGTGKPGASGSKAPSKPRALSNYEATMAGGTWVTDEFESADYEAGNLETLWGMNLWDYESRPLMMPDRPPDEAAVSASYLCSRL